jgi:hypothetical protein
LVTETKSALIGKLHGELVTLTLIATVLVQPPFDDVIIVKVELKTPLLP